MKDLLKLRQNRAAKVAELRGMLETVETRSDKQFTGDEKTKYDSIETEVRNMTSEIDREESVQALEKGSVVPAASPLSPGAKRSFGDFLMECRFNPASSGLARRDLTMADGPAMGFAVPPEFDAAIRMVDPQSAIIRPRATVIPAGTSPDAAFTMNALDQSGAKGIYSGVVMKWIAENAAVQESPNPTIRQVKLEPQQIAGFIDISDKLLRNAAAVGALVEKLLRSAIIGAEEAAFWTGDGIGKPLGIVGCPGSIEVSRAGGATTVTYADIAAMFAKLKFGGSPVWICSQTILPQLMTLRDAVGNAMWQPNLVQGNPSTLMGFPVLINDQSPVLGAKGDLALVDLGYYFIKDGSPLTILMNPYIQQTNGLTRIIAFWNVDAQPFVTTPLLQRDGVSTVSPFVVLK